MKRSLFYNIPSVTMNPVDKNGWSQKGLKVSLYYADPVREQTSLFIAEGIKDLWRLWQEIQGTPLQNEMLIVSSTHGGGIPDDLKQTNFFNSFKRVYFGHDNDKAGHATAKRALSSSYADVQNKAFRVIPPDESGKDWTDFFKAGRNVKDFMTLLDRSPEFSLEIDSDGADDLEREGEFEFNPIDLGQAFISGHLYYPTEVLFRERELVKRRDGSEEIQIVEGTRVKIVRSDRAILDVVSQPYSCKKQAGTLRKEIYRLSDNTLLDDLPKVNKKANTWQWRSIKMWQQGVYQPRPIGRIVEDLTNYLRGQIWLPYQDDYALLALSAVVTYSQAVYEAVPLLLATGEAGTGKSTLGTAMKEICANGTLIGQTSAASVARLIHETRGFVILDDLEKVAKSSDSAQVHELLQCLKVSYNKATARKQWTDMTKGGMVSELNFYGVKLINNTMGVDQVLGSRMFKIMTRKAPKGQFEQKDHLETEQLVALRNELHCWSFDYAAQLRIAYDAYSRTERIDEIAAPLRAICDLCEESLKITYHQSLDRAIERNKTMMIDPDDPADVLKEAMIHLVHQGFTSVTPIQVIMEIKTLVSPNYMRTHTTDIPEWQQESWIRHMIKQQGWIEPNSDRKARPYPGGRTLRFYKLTDFFINEVSQEHPEFFRDMTFKRGETFCSQYNNCHKCFYRQINCELADGKVAAAKKISR